jgi:hypothetical protein
MGSEGTKTCIPSGARRNADRGDRGADAFKEFVNLVRGSVHRRVALVIDRAPSSSTSLPPSSPSGANLEWPDVASEGFRPVLAALRHSPGIRSAVRTGMSRIPRDDSSVKRTYARGGPDLREHLDGIAPTDA